MLPKLIGEFHKVVRYKIDIEKFILFLYTSNNQKLKLKWEYHLQLRKKVKYLGIILTKDA